MHSEKAIRFIVGLGNPGKKYEKSPHNLGRRLVESIAKKQDRSWKEGRWFDWTDEIPSLVRLHSYMNVSGVHVSELIKKHRPGIEQVLICCDDFDLPLGTIRIRKSGSAGSHNGLKSVIREVRSQEFPRLRLGIGPIPIGQDPSEYVLRPFSKTDEEKVTRLIERAADAVEAIAAEDLESVMNRFNKSPS